ncbi:hypothetical protein, partial [Stutzerimonas kunmingensis]|uniref:hypothetical protein n=1 Tax=Stutzerimonas kunmingensis TaxID=1211807 RepID=UPI0028A6519B
GLKKGDGENWLIVQRLPSSAGLTHTLDALLLREHLLGRATPLPGVSNSAMSAFFVLELLNDQTYLPRHGMWMPVWMPRHLARDPLEAGIRIFWLIGSYHDDGTNHQLSGLPG